MKSILRNTILISFLLLFVNSCSKDAPVSEEPSTTQYTLTVNASEGGSVTPDANGTYNREATITVTDSNISSNVSCMFFILQN